MNQIIVGLLSSKSSCFAVSSMAAFSNELLSSIDNLQAVLDDDFILSELQFQNQNLLNYLTKPVCLEKMVSLCLQVEQPKLVKPHGKSTKDGPVPFDASNKMHFNIASVSSDVLSTNCEPLTNALLSNSKTCKMLAFFLSNKPKGSLNPVIAAFYTKIIVSLTSKEPPKTLEMLKENDKYVQSLCMHSDVSSMGPLIYAFVTAPHPDSVSDAYKQWLATGGLVDGMIKAFGGYLDEPENAAFLWGELIHILRDIQYSKVLKNEKAEDPLLSALQSKESVTKVLDAMFQADATKEAVVFGCSLLIQLLTTVYIPNNPNELEAEAGSNYGLRGGHPLSPSIHIWSPDPNHVVEDVLAERVGDITKLISGGLKTLEKADAKLPVGKERAFGQARYSAVKLIAQMLAMNHAGIHQQILKHHTLKKLLEVCTNHPWNNLLHVSVSECMSAVLFSRLPGPIPAPQLNEEEEKKLDEMPMEQRLAHKMNVICEYSEDSPLIKHLLKEVSYLAYLSKNVDQRKEASFKKTGTFIGHFYEMCGDVENAREKGPNKKVINNFLTDSAAMGSNWNQFVASTLTPYQNKIKPYPVDAPRHDEATGILFDKEEDLELGTTPASTHKNFVDFQSLVTLTETFGLGLDNVPDVDTSVQALGGDDDDLGVAQLGNMNK